MLSRSEIRKQAVDLLEKIENVIDATWKNEGGPDQSLVWGFESEDRDKLGHELSRNGLWLSWYLDDRGQSIGLELGTEPYRPEDKHRVMFDEPQSLAISCILTRDGKHMWMLQRHPIDDEFTCETVGKLVDKWNLASVDTVYDDVAAFKWIESLIKAFMNHHVQSNNDAD